VARADGRYHDLRRPGRDRGSDARKISGLGTNHRGKLAGFGLDGVPPSGASAISTPTAAEFGREFSERRDRVRGRAIDEDHSLFAPALTPIRLPDDALDRRRVVVTHRNRISELAATSAAVFTSLAPSATKLSTGARFLLPMIVRDNPWRECSWRMPWPMKPTPIKPMRSSSSLRFLSSGHDDVHGFLRRSIRPLRAR